MRKLYRSSRDRKIFGVCGGLAEYLGFDATLLRILLIVVTIFSGGSLIIVYILAGLVVPQEPHIGGAFNGGYGGGFGGFGGNGGYGGASGGNGGNGGYGWNSPPQSPPPSTGWKPGTPWPGPSGSSHAGSPGGPVRPEPAQTAAPRAAASSAPELDAMMEDIEKKALRRELEELKARIAKFEQQSKGEE